MSDITIKDVEEYLDSIPMFGKAGTAAANFDLNRMRKFCERMGNPQKNFRSIHVGGTNGKGTVCRMLASVYKESGFKVGLYTSPHLLDFRERFQINAQKIGNDQLLDFFDEYGEYLYESKFTYFEITTAIAFWYFSEENIDVVVLEVGLGGRLDATNVIEPLISVITSIGLDHTNILGNSLDEIAGEKAGIIKKNTPVVIGNLPDEAELVIRSAAESKNSKLLKITDLDPVYEDQKITLRRADPPLTVDGINRKKIDAQNVAVAYQVVETLKVYLPVRREEFRNGIAAIATRFPRNAVFEKLSSKKPWYFDGAHNVESVSTLTSHMQELAPPKKWTVVLSFMRDKLTDDIAVLWNKFPLIYLYEMEGERAATVDEMKMRFPSARVTDNGSFLQKDHFKSELVIFSGSFYFYSIVSNWMGAIASAD